MSRHRKGVKAPASYTLEQVKCLLAKVAAHPRLGELNVIAILKGQGGGVSNADSLAPASYASVSDKCQRELERADKEQVSADKRKASLQDAKDKLEIAGKEIAAQIKKAKELERAAEKFAQHWRTVGQRLAAARPLCKAAGVSFEDFRKQYAPEYSPRRLREILAIAEHRKTETEHNKENAGRQAAYRKRLKDAAAKSGVSNAATTVLHDDDEPEPKARGNNVDTEASAAERKHINEALDAEPAPAPAPYVPTPEEASDQALANFERCCQVNCPVMTESNLKKARVYLMMKHLEPK